MLACKGMNVVDQLVEVLTLLPSAIVQVYALSRLFAVRRGFALGVWFFLVSLAFGFIRSTLDPSARTAVSIAVTAAIYAPYIAFSTVKPLAARVFIALATLGCSALAEASTTLILFCLLGNFAGPDVYGSAHPAIMALRVVHVAILASSFGVLHRFVQRRSHDLPNRNPWLFVVFPATQAVMLVLLVYLGQFAELEQRQGNLAFTFYAGFVVLCAVCAVVDAVYVHVFEESAKARRDRMRLEVLQDVIDEEIARGAEVMRSIERTERLRHDLANQLSVARELAQRGNVESARKHVRDMRAMLEAEGAA